MRTLVILAVGLLPFAFAGSSCAFAQEEKKAQEEHLKQLKEKQLTVRVETSRRAWLGVSLSDMNAGLAKEQGLKADEGAFVREVIEDSPAEKAGFEEGDVVVEFNGRSIYDADDLTKAVRKAEPGATVKAVVLRKDGKKTIEVKLGKTPRNSLARAFSLGVPLAPHVSGHTMRSFSTSTSGISGLSLQTLNSQLAEYFEVPGGEGVLVERVKKGSAGAKAGFKAGDVILKVGDVEVSEIADVWDAVDDAEKGEKAAVEILRKGKKQALTLEIEKTSWKIRRQFGDADEDLDIYIHEPMREYEMQRNSSKLKELREELRGLGKEISTKMKETQRELQFKLQALHNNTVL